MAFNSEPPTIQTPQILSLIYVWHIMLLKQFRNVFFLLFRCNTCLLYFAFF